VQRVQTVSFIIPLFNHLAHTQAMLASLRATIPAGLAHEIILIDDDSTDGTQAWLEGLSDPRLHVLLNPSNLGYAKTNNAGARMAKGEVLGFLNNDLLLEPGWLEPMLALLESPTLNAACVGNVQHRVADAALDHAGVRLTCLGQFEHIQALAEAGPGYAPVLAVTGACMLIRRADFEQVGGFDEAFVNGCEDVDLCYRLRAARKSVYVANTSRIRHHVSLSRGRESLQNERNSRHLFGKWRAQIKNELSAQWAALLQAGPEAYQPYIHGTLSPAFLATPQLAGRTIAEAMLQRQEQRWARELDGADPNANLAARQSMGTTPPLELSVQGLSSTRNFYVCGYKAGQPPAQAIAITISVNSIQQQTFTLGAEPNFNVGIINPLVLPGVANCFKVTFRFVDAAGQQQGDASKAVVVTQLVLDDQILKGDATLFPLRTST
jgi:GT2 family glycosyltransferase